MDRNTIFGMVIIVAILVVFGIVNKPSQEQLEQARRRQDSLALAEQQRDLNDKTEPEKVQATAFTDSTDINPDTTRYADLYGSFAASATGSPEFVTLENDKIRVTLTNRGGRVYSVLLKDYLTFDGRPLILFDGDSTVFGLNFFSQNRQISTNELYFAPSAKGKLIADTTSRSISMKLDAGQGNYIEYVYTLAPGQYMVDCKLNLAGANKFISENVNSLDLIWDMYIPQQERGKKNELNYTMVSYKFFADEEVERMKPGNKELVQENITTKLHWVAFKDQFFSSVLVSDNSLESAILQSRNLPETDTFLRNFRAEMTVPIQATQQQTVPFRFYFGPNHYQSLRKIDGLELQELVDLGGPINRTINRYVIIALFNYLERFISNYGIIILLLTIIIKIGLFPLTFGSYKSQAKLRVLKPQIDEINARIPADKPMERQKATMELYKKVGVNPMGGCLPLLLQMPILFAMFKFFPTSIELRQEGFLWATDLSTYDSIFEWQKQIPIISKFYGNHISLFTILMTITTIISVKTSSQATSSTTQMPGMKGMMYMMPVMFMFVLNSFSAGLTYYYFLANVITFGQNWIFKFFIKDEDVLKKIHARKAKPVKKSSFQARMEEMARKRGMKLPK